MDITSRWHGESVMPATRSGTAILRISASWAHRSDLMSPSELACSLLPLRGLRCAPWSWHSVAIEYCENRFWLVSVKIPALTCALDGSPISTRRNGMLAAESAIREYDATRVPRQPRGVVLITSAGVAPDPTKQDVIDSDFHQRDRGIDPGGGADVAVRVGPGHSSQVASERAGSPGRARSGGRLAADRASRAVRSRGPGRGNLRRHSCRGLRRFLDAGVPRAADRRFRDQTRSHDRRSE